MNLEPPTTDAVVVLDMLNDLVTGIFGTERAGNVVPPLRVLPTRFYETGLDQQLRSLGVDRVVVAGPTPPCAVDTPP